LNQLVSKYPDGLTRCFWPKQDDLYVHYHDTEWGVELRGDDELFEKLALEGFQAGLSWITILRRREAFQKAFRGFEITKVAKMKPSDIERLMNNESIIRNRAKIAATIQNARVCLTLTKPLTEIIWSHAPKKKTRRESASDFSWPTQSPESIALSKELKSLGFSFVGPTTMYALMQSVGMINDHAPGCFRRNQLR